MSSAFIDDPAFHDQTMGLLGPGLWRDLLAVLGASTAYGLSQGAFSLTAASAIFALAAAIGWGARQQEQPKVQAA